jgi:hypothetical protein
VTFIVVEMVAKVADCLGMDCLMKRAVEARRVDVRSVLRGWWRRSRGSMQIVEMNARRRQRGSAVRLKSAHNPNLRGSQRNGGTLRLSFHF